MKCEYPNCKTEATKLWALVPLCETHHEIIRKETIRYYTRKIYIEQREEYYKIVDKIPWARKDLF